MKKNFYNNRNTQTYPNSIASLSYLHKYITHFCAVHEKKRRSERRFLVIFSLQHFFFSIS